MLDLQKKKIVKNNFNNWSWSFMAASSFSSVLIEYIWLFDGHM